MLCSIVYIYDIYIYMLSCSLQVNRINLGRANNVGANAAFKSRSKRDAFNLREQISKPAPCKFIDFW